MTVDKIEVNEKRDHWIIKRRPSHKPIRSMAEPDPEYDDILITPGVNRKRKPPVVPVEINMPKKYGDIGKVIDQTIPSIDMKEEDCSICKKAEKRLRDGNGPLNGLRSFKFLDRIKDFRDKRPKILDIWKGAP